jgi:glutamine amidotransferase-like uncharacterized protein
VIRPRPGALGPVAIAAGVWLLAAFGMPAASLAATAPRDGCPSCVADFALYDPGTADDGVWDEDVVALQSIFNAYGFTWRKVDAAAIARGALGSGKGRRFRAIVEPGGWAYTRDASLGFAGVSRLRSFVSSGGAYVGFCAGAWAAVSLARWDYYGNGWFQSYPYNLRLFNGAGVGPLGWIPWNDGTNANFAEATIDTTNATMRAAAMPARTRFLYGGGPWFEPSGRPPGWEVWARAVAPAGALSRAGDGKPTIVRHGYGKGTVILFAYHPEILVGSDLDGVVLTGVYDEATIDWDTGSQSFEEIALDSWNVVHAALQVAAGRPVTPLTALPE